MNAVLSLGLGYFIGCINPAAIIGKLKHVNLKEKGTGNLGATNTTLVLGKAAGVFVMLFDILKSFFSAKLARYLFPQLMAAGMIACIGVILGHCFPVFMHFQGGKGLAAFGGMVLAYKPIFFLQILIPGIVLIVLLNTGVAMPVLGSVMFPVLVWLYRGEPLEILLALAASVILVTVHWPNVQKALTRTDVIFTRDFLHKLFRKDKNET